MQQKNAAMNKVVRVLAGNHAASKKCSRKKYRGEKKTAAAAALHPTPIQHRLATSRTKLEVVSRTPTSYLHPTPTSYLELSPARKRRRAAKKKNSSTAIAAVKHAELQKKTAAPCARRGSRARSHRRAAI